MLQSFVLTFLKQHKYIKWHYNTERGRSDTPCSPVLWYFLNEDHREVRESLDHHDSAWPLALIWLCYHTNENTLLYGSSIVIQILPYMHRQFWRLSALFSNTPAACNHLLRSSTEVLHGILCHFVFILRYYVLRGCGPNTRHLSAISSTGSHSGWVSARSGGEDGRKRKCTQGRREKKKENTKHEHIIT